MPAGYTALEYLESTGTQWIDTGIYFDYSKNFRVIGKAINLNLSLRNVILGSFYNDNDNKSLNFEFGGGGYPQYSGHFRVWAGDRNNYMFSTESIPTNTEILYNSVYDSNLRKIDTTITYNDTNQNIQFVISGINGICQRTLRFFKDDRPSNDVAHPLRIGEHKIYKNDILVRNFIPAQRNSDGVLGMYDMVTNTFFTNNGTGEFIAGPVITLGNQVLTNTGTAGEYGTKGIYNATGEYAAQTQNLVDAATMNAGVQNAIDSEFQCIEWLDPNDHSSDCLLFDIFGTTAKSASKNLFNLDNTKVIYKSSTEITTTKNSDGFTVTYPTTATTSSYSFVFVELGDINDFRGKTLTISAKSRCENGGKALYSLTRTNDNATSRPDIGGRTTLTIPNTPDDGMTKIAFRLYATAGGAGTNPSCTYYDIMVEEGAVATAYEPYKNLYIPAGE